MAPRGRAVEAEALPEADRAGDLPHPRERFELFGHEAAARTLAEAAGSGRLHHAWIIAGPKGVGKATLAWRFARALLAHGPANCPDDLSTPEQHPVSRMIAALTHPDVLLIRKPWDYDKKRLKTVVTVDEVRRLRSFFSQHASTGGYRIAIVDAADDMNTQAQNALLKVLEEPPARGLLMLISQAPGGLLPTTRSRCRMLTLRPLEEVAMQTALSVLAPKIDAADRALLSALATGAPGRAAELADNDALALYREIVDLLTSLPRLPGARLIQFAEKVAKLDGGLARFVDLLAPIEERLLRGTYAPLPAVPGEEALLRHLRAAIAPQRWSALWDDLRARAVQTDELNLDKKQLVLNTFFALEQAARG